MTELDEAKLRGELTARLRAPGFLTHSQAERHADVVLEVLRKQAPAKTVGVALSKSGEPFEYDASDERPPHAQRLIGYTKPANLEHLAVAGAAMLDVSERRVGFCTVPIYA